MTIDEKRAIVIKAIITYDDMKLISKTTPKTIRKMYDDLKSPRTSKFDGISTPSNINLSEEYLIDGLNIIDEQLLSYSKAVAFLKWFEPKWKSFTKDERELLATLKYSKTHNGVLVKLAERKYFDPRQLRRQRQKLLKKLLILLFP